MNNLRNALISLGICVLLFGGIGNYIYGKQAAPDRYPSSVGHYKYLWELGKSSYEYARDSQQFQNRALVRYIVLFGIGGTLLIVGLSIKKEKPQGKP